MGDHARFVSDRIEPFSTFDFDIDQRRIDAGCLCHFLLHCRKIGSESWRLSHNDRINISDPIALGLQL